MNITLEKSTEPDFARGERIIMGDGVRWGRTRVAHHGVHGTSHTFEQEGGEALIEKDGRYPQLFNVRSMRKRFSNAAEWKPTETLVLEKAIWLVENGKLRDPAIVRAEQKAANERYRQQRAEAQSAEAVAMRERARQALARVGYWPTKDSDIDADIDAVVAAMQWAQTR